MSPTYIGWICERGTWIQVAQGGTLTECHRNLLDRIRKFTIMPERSAVLPCGTDPGRGPPEGEEEGGTP